MGKLSGELRRLKGAVGKLSAAKRGAGVGADWLVVWQWVDDVDGAQAALPRDVPRAAADLLVCHRHARAFGIDTRPDVAKALREAAIFIAVQWHPPPGISWEQRGQLDELVRGGVGTARSLVVAGFGLPDGPMGELPPGGRPWPPTPAPTTPDEVAAVVAWISVPVPFDLALLAEEGTDEPDEQKGTSQ